MADNENNNNNNNNNNLFSKNNNNDNRNNNLPPPLPILPNQDAQGPIPSYHNENNNNNENNNENNMNNDNSTASSNIPNDMFMNSNGNDELAEKKTLGNIINNSSITEQSIDSSELNPSVEFNQMLDRVMASDIPRKDKIKILLKFKEDMLHPERGEKRELEKLESQYSKLVNPDTSSSTNRAEYPSTFNSPVSRPAPLQPPIPPMPPQQPQYMYAGQQPYFSPYQMPQPNFGYMMPQMMQPQQTMSTQQFEILKTKLDTIQLEMIDVVRHLKDYSKKYMMAVRQDDMSKLDTYVRDLINVDKKLEDTKKVVDEQREVIAEAQEEAEEEEEEKSLFGKATSGMKGMIGSFGDNLGSVTDLVKNTASATNDMLKKNILPTSENEEKPTENQNKNIVSVDDYANQAVGETTPEQPTISSELPATTPESVLTPANEVQPLPPSNDNNNDDDNDNNDNEPLKVETPPIGENAGAEVKTGEKPEKGLEDEINTLDKKIKNEIAKNIGTEVQKGGGRNKTKKKGNLKHRRKTPKRQPKKTKKKLRK